MSQFVSTRDGLTSSDTKSLAPAHARIVKSLAGRTRFLAEMASGRSIADDEAAMAPRNPQGLLGVDLSGPPFGSAPRHPLAWQGGFEQGGDWTGPDVVLEVVSGVPLTIPLARVTVRNFASSPKAPYSRAYLSLAAYQSAGVAAFDVFVRMTAHGTSRDGVFSVASTTPAAADIDGVGGDVVPFVDLAPGANSVKLEFTTASSTAAIILCWSLNQIAKRSH